MGSIDRLHIYRSIDEVIFLKIENDFVIDSIEALGQTLTPGESLVRPSPIDFGAQYVKPGKAKVFSFCI
jgi:hypothetical protein